MLYLNKMTEKRNRNILFEQSNNAPRNAIKLLSSLITDNPIMNFKNAGNDSVLQRNDIFNHYLDVTMFGKKNYFLRISNCTTPFVATREWTGALEHVVTKSRCMFFDFFNPRK
jgi:hypothetical protein